MHALIIEDEVIMALAIEDVLRECGFNSFDVAGTAQSAIGAAARRRPDLITSDVRLEAGCGIDAIQAIGQSSPIPVVFITGHEADVARRLPTHLVLNKPFSERDLISAGASAMLEIGGSNPLMSELRDKSVEK